MTLDNRKLCIKTWIDFRSLKPFFEILQSVETNDAEYPYDTPRNQRKFPDFDDFRGEEAFDRLPEKRTKSDELKGKCYSRFGFSTFRERMNENITCSTFKFKFRGQATVEGLNGVSSKKGRNCRRQA